MVQTESKIKRDLAIKIGGYFFSKGVGLLTLVVLSKTLSVSSVGTFLLLLATLSVVLVSVQFGFPQAAIRFMSDDRQRRGPLSFTLVLISLLALVALGMVLALCGRDLLPFLVNNRRLPPYILGLGLLVLPGRLVLVFAYQYLQSRHETLARTVIEDLAIPGSLFLACLAALLPLGGSTLTIIVLLYAALITICGCLAFAMLRRLRLITVSLDVSSLGEVVRYSWPIYATGLLATVFSSVDVVMVGVLGNNREVAIYAVGARIAMLAGVGLTAAEGLIMPYAAASGGEAENRDEFTDIYDTFLGYLCALAILTVVVIVSLSDYLHVLFADAYGASRGVLLILVFGWTFAALLGPAGPALNMIGREKRVMFDMIISVATMVILNLLLIPRYGALGAAVATCAAILVLHGRNFLHGLTVALNPRRLSNIKRAGGSLLMSAMLVGAYFVNSPIKYSVFGATVIFGLFTLLGTRLAAARKRKYWHERARAYRERRA